MCIWSSMSSSLEFWSVNDTEIYENFMSKVFKNIKYLGEISNNWSDAWLETKTLDHVDNHCWWYSNELILLQ